MTRIKNFLSRHSKALSVLSYALIIYTLVTASIMLCIDGLTYLTDTPGNSSYWSMLAFKDALRALPVVGFIPSQLLWVRIIIYIVISILCLSCLLAIDKIKEEKEEEQERVELQNYLDEIERERKRIKSKRRSTMTTLLSISTKKD